MSEFKEVKKRQQKAKEEEDPTELESLSGELLDPISPKFLNQGQIPFAGTMGMS